MQKNFPFKKWQIMCMTQFLRGKLPVTLQILFFCKVKFPFFSTWMNFFHILMSPHSWTIYTGDIEHFTTNSYLSFNKKDPVAPYLKPVNIKWIMLYMLLMINLSIFFVWTYWRSFSPSRNVKVLLIGFSMTYKSFCLIQCIW